MNALRAGTMSVLALAWAASARAEEPPAMDSLEHLLDESVVTTASRSAERASTAPATVFTITAAEIQAFGIRSIDEALAFLGVGMHVQKARDYNTGVDVGAQGIMLRDLGRHLLVLLDGHVMNAPHSGDVSLHEGLGVPLDAIDHIEVMLGAGSVMYGSNAMTAVVQVVTRSAVDFAGTHVSAELSVAPPVGYDGYTRKPRDVGEVGFRHRIGVGGAYAFKLGRLPGSASVRAEWLEERSQTYAVRPFTSGTSEVLAGLGEWGGLASHDMRSPSVVAALELGAFTVRLQGGRYQRSMPFVGTYDDPDARERRGGARFDIGHEALLSKHIALSSRLYGDHTHTRDTSDFTNAAVWCIPGEQSAGCRFEPFYTGRALGLEQRLEWDPRLDGSLVTTVGYDVRYRHASGSPSEITDLQTGKGPSAFEIPRFSEHTFLSALFAQVVYQPFALLSVNVGARLDIDSVYGARVSPRVALVLTPGHGTVLRAIYAEAFRGPTSLELHDFDVTYQVPPRSLAPETARTAELSLQQHLGWATLDLRGFVALYKRLVNQRAVTEEEFDRALSNREVIPTADPAYIRTTDNLDDLYSAGGTLTVQLRPVERLSIAASTTYSRLFRGGERPMWPRLFGNFRVSYALWREGPTLALAALYAHARRASNENPFTLVGEPKVTDQLDLRLTLSSHLPKLPGLQLRASAGAQVRPDLPYLVSTPLETNPSIGVQFDHSQPQLYLMLGAQYRF